MEYRNCYNALLASYCLDSDLRFGKSCSTFRFSDSGFHLGRPLTLVLLPSLLTIRVRVLPLIIASNCRSSSGYLDGLVFRRCRLSAESFSSEVRRRHEAEFLVGGVEIVVSRFSSPSPPPGLSWISGQDPLLVVASCNSP